VDDKGDSSGGRGEALKGVVGHEVVGSGRHRGMILKNLQEQRGLCGRGEGRLQMTDNVVVG
jgi:hypothetical protein